MECFFKLRPEYQLRIIVVFGLIILQIMESHAPSDRSSPPPPTQVCPPRSPSRPSRPSRPSNPSGIILRLPDYQRYSREYPTLLRDFTKCDSLLDEVDREIEIAPRLAWVLLLANMLLAAMVPCWLISDLKYESLTRNSWRFLTASLLTLPFVFYEKRQVIAVGGSLYSQINSQMLKQNFMASVTVCVWFLVIRYAVYLTSLLHVFSLMGLQAFFSGIRKQFRKQQHHEFESAGVLLVVTGLLCTLYDSATGPIIPGLSNQIYLSYSNFSRFGGDILSLLGGCINLYLSQNFIAPTQPQFLNALILNFFIGFNLVWFGYFFGGSELSFDEFYGVFGVLSRENFPSMFYIGVMLGFNLMIGNILIKQIFSKLIIRISSCFTALIMTVLCHLLNIQRADSALSALSFGFIIPGLIFIIIGEGMLEGSEAKMNFVLYRLVEEAKGLLEETKGLSQEGIGPSLEDGMSLLLKERKALSFALEEVEMQDMSVLAHWEKKHSSQNSL